MPPLPLTIHLFGPLRVIVHGELMPRPRGRSIEWLLALLTLRSGRALDRAWLAGTLWPESEEQQALHNLRDALVHLRKAFGPERERLHSPTRDTLTLDLEGAEVDVLRFDRAIQSGDEDSLRAAVELYTAPLLEGCLEEWVAPERSSREQACLRALETLAEAAEARGEFGEALSLLRRAESKDALRDSTRRGLMRVLAASGDVPAALYAFREYRVRLREEMNVEPDEETVRLFQQIRGRSAVGSRQLAVSGQEGQPGGAVTPSPPHPVTLSPGHRTSSLPHPLTRLLGREEEAREIVQALSRSRLVTLTGGGGVGKTRLAIQVAGEVTAASEEEAVFVALASISDPAAVPVFVAEALGLRDEGSVGPEMAALALTNYLSMRRTLLVLDNCEHLAVAAAALTQSLLERCPTLRVLTTSRQRLGLTGEIVWRVRPLALPELSADTAAILRAPAVQLFLERAAMAQPEITLTAPEEAAVVARICQRLEGIPLAIELAAARVGALSLEQIATRLDDRFRLLTGGSTAVLPRHQTLRALIDWSYDLLSEEEKRLLRTLSVFTGGWTLEAAEGVSSEFSALDLLCSLADKSLVQIEHGRGGARYRMLETIREYALNKLGAANEEESARLAHLSWAMNMAEQESRQLFGSHPGPALDRLQMEIENLRSALSFARSGRAPEGSLLRLASSLWLLWDMRGYLLEGRAHLQAALESDPLEDSPSRAQALLGAAVLAHELREYRLSGGYAREALSLFRKLGDDAGTAAGLLHMGYVHLIAADLAAARPLLAEAHDYCHKVGWIHGCGIVLALMALAAVMAGDDSQSAERLGESLKALESADNSRTPSYCTSFYLGSFTYHFGRLAGARSVLAACVHISRRAGEKRGVALTVRALGEVAGRQGDTAFALACLQEVAGIYREIGNFYALAYALLDIGNWHYRARDYVSACTAYSESLDSFRTLGYSVGLDTACNNLGSTLFHLGEPQRARQLHREALSHYRKSEDREGIAWSLERLAVVEAHEGEPNFAAALFGAAERVRKEYSRPMDHWDQADWDLALIHVRSLLGDDALFDAAWQDGRTMSTEQFIAFALQER